MYTRLDAKRCSIARAIDPHPKEIVMSGPAIMTSSYLVVESGIPLTGYFTLLATSCQTWSLNIRSVSVSPGVIA